MVQYRAHRNGCRGAATGIYSFLLFFPVNMHSVTFLHPFEPPLFYGVVNYP